VCRGEGEWGFHDHVCSLPENDPKRQHPTEGDLCYHCPNDALDCYRCIPTYPYDDGWFNECNPGGSKYNDYDQECVCNDYRDTDCDSNCRVSGITTTSTSTTSTISEFIGTNFVCNSISGGYRCKFDYTNGLGENAIVVFYYSDSGSGEVKSAPAPEVGEGSGTASSLLICSSVGSGTYYVDWEVYRASDSSLSDEITWSTSYKTIVC